MNVELSRKLFKVWNDNNVCYCHWKSNEHLVPGLDGDTDLDVLVKETDRNKAEQGLAICMYKKCYSQYGSRYPGVDDWVGLDLKTGKMIHIHLHYQIVTGHKGMKEYILPWSELALATRIRDEYTSVFIMEPNLEIMTLYTRIALKASIKRMKTAKRGQFKLGQDDLMEIAYLKGRIDWNDVESLLERFYRDKAGAVAELMKKDDLSSVDFLRLVKLVQTCRKEDIRKDWIPAKMKQYYYAIALRVLSFVKNRLGFNIVTRKTTISGQGVIIAFIGQDGAGKSTVTSDVLKWLNWKLEAKKFYLGSGEHYASWQKKLHARLPHKKNAITTAIGAWLTLSDYVSLAKKVKTTIKAAQKYADKGGIAIFDRYPQVAYHGINDGPKIRVNYVPKIKNPIVKKYALLCAEQEERYLNAAVQYTPDVVIKLILPPEVSMQRKPEENFETVKRKHDIIKQLDFQNAEVYVIDATMPYEEEIRKIKELIWQRIR